MTPSNTLPTAILDTVVAHLAPIFQTTGKIDANTAKQAATHTLAAYNPQDEQQLHLAAEIISFSFHALEALSQAAAPGLSLAKVLRLRGSAVSLSRQAHKSRRKLDQLQKPPVQKLPVQQPNRPQPRPEPSQPIAIAPAVPQPPAKPKAQTWTQAYHQRLTEKRLTEKHQARHQPIATPHPATAITTSG